MSNWNRVFKPIVVLCVICIVITGALAATNSATAPIIAEAKAAAEKAARSELLPEADDFTEITDVAVENVTAVFKANNDTGYVITSTAKGYGGTMTVMVAFTPEKTIKQIKVTEQGETQGIGSKVAGTPSYWERYQGQPATELKINKDGGTIDAESGATISSRALAKAVSSAIEAYNAVNP
ncbi:RnfABCDGE type electron transport complex subunit G [Pseudoflavonifractor sp. 60]|uniref:RnfABCDGE type electron transport complex subunit G n=1 Tax=Pseudoflavonifractor sp. 60 TaxID=2304576 RepID=UPI00136B7C76|nr:RnfABCDGE type electron transport complex subunit G [Pseudoflavonifractor sp. 60]NBI66198.1 RnfABCDGE type electron transport complex subunit G [Pseudoflavonifractor sp. 60]